MTRDFGFELKSFVSGSDFARQIVKSGSTVANLAEREPKNELERNVIDALRRVTDSVLSNVVIQYGKPSESYEYDALVVVRDDLMIDFEATNYETVKETIRSSAVKESMKSTIVLNTLDKGRRLKLRPAIVVKGFPEETLGSLREIANSREMDLFTDEEFSTQIENYLLANLLKRREVPLLTSFRDYFNWNI